MESKPETWKSAFLLDYFMEKNYQTNLRWCGGCHWSSWHGMIQLLTGIYWH